VKEALVELERALGEIFGQDVGSGGGVAEGEFRSRLRNALSQAMEGTDRTAVANRYRTGLGIDLDLSEGSRKVFVLNKGELARALRDNAGDVLTLLTAKENSHGFDGLLAGFDSAVDELRTDLLASAGGDSVVGLLVNKSE
jgi:hypothetical protein